LEENWTWIDDLNKPRNIIFDGLEMNEGGVALIIETGNILSGGGLSNTMLVRLTEDGTIY